MKRTRYPEPVYIIIDETGSNKRCYSGQSVLDWLKEYSLTEVSRKTFYTKDYIYTHIYVTNN